MSGMRHANLHYSHPDSYLFCLCWCCHQQTEGARFSTEIIGSIPVCDNTNRGAGYVADRFYCRGRESPRGNERYVPCLSLSYFQISHRFYFKIPAFLRTLYGLLGVK